jgi:uncharacterized Zn-binding protein involved in type VI secretion
MRRVIRLGDRTSHGGYVVSATSQFTVMGMDVARLGDKCTCPKKGHNNCYIVEGDPDWTIDGVPVALEGHKLSCGAVLISSMPNAGRDEWGGDSAAATLLASNVTQKQGVEALTKPGKDTDEQIRIRDADGNRIANVPYYIMDESGNAYRGFSDAQGCCERIRTDDVQMLEILLGVPALEKW